MKPAPFDYLRADDISAALSALHDAGEDARVLAGGQSLGAMLNMRLAKPSLLIDIMHIEALGAIREEKAALVIPACVTQEALLRRSDLHPLLAKALPWTGHVQTRARGTVCGSIAHADPSAELPLCLALLGGEVSIRSRRKRRTVQAADFFRGMMLTDLRPGEMIEAVRIPLARKNQRFAFTEIGRRHGDFAIVAVAAMREGDTLRLTVGGVNDTPAIREWATLDTADIPDALNDLAWSLDARDDLHATARYRRDLVRNLGRIVIEEVSS